MRKIKDKIILLLIVIVIALGCFVVGTLVGQKDGEKTVSIATVEESINSLNELVTVEYNYTNIAKYEESKEFYGYTIPFTTTKFIYTYDGVIKYGYDLSQATVTVVDNNVNVTLPEAMLISHTIDYDSISILDEQYSIFTQVEITDYTSFYQDQTSTTEAKAEENGIYSTAEENAKTIITQLVKSLLGDEAVVTFD